MVKKLLFLLAFIVCLASGLTAEAGFAAPVTSPFGPRGVNPVTGEPEGIHCGVDFGIPAGTGIPSPVVGEVLCAGDQGDGYGISIIIREDDTGDIWRFAHNSEALVDVGDHVSIDTPLAYSGNTGLSTGDHLHVEILQGPGDAGSYYSAGSYAMDPSARLYAGGWSSSSGDISTSAGSYVGIAGHVIPNIDFDFSSYFAPNATLLSMTKELIDLITPALDFAEDNLVTLLLTLCALDLSFWACMGMIRGSIEIGELFPKIIRYGFFITVLRSWHWMVSYIFVPMVEGFSGTYSGTDVDLINFLKFDEVYSALGRFLGPFIHIDPGLGGLGTMFFSLIFVAAILILTLALTLYLIVKLVNFYIMCVLGALGIPMLITKWTRTYGQNYLSGIFVSIMDLIITIAMYSCLSVTIKQLEPLTTDQFPELMAFAILWFLMVVWVPKFTGECCRSLDNFLSAM